MSLIHEYWTEDLIVPTKDINVGLLPLDIYRRLAGLIQRLNFGCTFEDNGDCCGYSNSEWARLDKFYSWHVGCCCTICKDYIGYWDDQPVIDIAQLKVMAKSFGRYGFWRRGKGCILPWIYRSPTCLAYKCNNNAVFNSTETLLIETIRLGTYRKYYQDFNFNTVPRLAMNLGIVTVPTSHRDAIEKIVEYCDRVIPR